MFGNSTLKRKVARLEKQLADTKLQEHIAVRKYMQLLQDYNALVGRINRLGGEEFLRKARIPGAHAPNGQFSKAEIKSLISLCHPDKHQGKDSAVRITQKLLRMK